MSGRRWVCYGFWKVIFRSDSDAFVTPESRQTLISKKRDPIALHGFTKSIL
jgi:hypothetical protein